LLLHPVETLTGGTGRMHEQGFFTVGFHANSENDTD
jgi:hypothetical protein